jgi:uncharacterized protein
MSATSVALTERELSILVESFRLFPEIESVIVYGSRATARNKRFSDIDMAITASADVSSMLKLHIAEDTVFPYFCDIVRYNDQSLSMNLKQSIDRDGVVIYIKSE